MSSVTLKNINKVYDNNVQAVFDFNLDIKDGEFIVLVGPSGCGKSTTLRMIAGLEEITDGELHIDGVYSNDLLPKNRDIAMVFQNYALYPHMSVYENMAFGLKNRKIEKEIIEKRVHDAASILSIQEYLSRKPKALSGGQCQRVALGRAIVRQAKVFLMDEPLSNLDAKLRVQMRSEIIKLHKRIGAITIYVTHDQTEAMTMADRIVVMSKGYIQQIGTPREVYNHPTNLFVAGFMGSPSMNFLDCELNGSNVNFEGYNIKLNDEQMNLIKNYYSHAYSDALNELTKFDEKFIDRNMALEKLEKFEALDDSNPKKKEFVASAKDLIARIENDSKARKAILNKIEYFKNFSLDNANRIILGVRPEDINASFDDKSDSLPIDAKVDVVELLGHNQIVHLNVGHSTLQVEVSAKKIVNIGDSAKIDIKDYFHLFDPVSEKAIF